VCVCVCLYLSVRTITFQRNDLDLDIWHDIMFHRDHSQVQDQGHESKFAVTGGKNSHEENVLGYACTLRTYEVGVK